MMTQPLIIGEAPPPVNKPSFPLEGRPGDLLARWAGLGSTSRDLLRYFRACNLLSRNPGLSWPTMRARCAAGLVPLPEVVVCLGRHVQDAVSEAHGFNHEVLALAHAAFFEWVRDEATGRFFVVIPHPSGLNRLYNEPATRELAGETLRYALEVARREDRRAA